MNFSCNFDSNSRIFEIHQLTFSFQTVHQTQMKTHRKSVTQNSQKLRQTQAFKLNDFAVAQYWFFKSIFIYRYMYIYISKILERYSGGQNITRHRKSNKFCYKLICYNKFLTSIFFLFLPDLEPVSLRSFTMQWWHIVELRCLTIFKINTQLLDIQYSVMLSQRKQSSCAW